MINFPPHPNTKADACRLRSNASSPPRLSDEPRRALQWPQGRRCPVARLWLARGRPTPRHAGMPLVDMRGQPPAALWLLYTQDDGNMDPETQAHPLPGQVSQQTSLRHSHSASSSDRLGVLALPLCSLRHLPLLHPLLLALPQHSHTGHKPLPPLRHLLNTGSLLLFFLRACFLPPSEEGDFQLLTI